MPLINAKCTNCGGALQVDSKKRLAVCPYCKEPYVVEEAINNYTYTTNNYINADVVNVTAKIEDDFVIRGGVLEKYNGEAMDVVIPDGVVAINGAFRDCIGISQVTIPDSVKTIGEHSFSGCKNLKSVTLPDGLEEIDEYAFSGCSKLRIQSLPSSIKKIEHGAFSGCTSMKVKSINIDGDDIEIGYFVFQDFGALEKATIKGTNIKLGWNVFSNCRKLEEIAVYGDEIETDCCGFIGENTGLKKLILSTVPENGINLRGMNQVEVIGPFSMRNEVEEHKFTPIPPNQLSIQNLKKEQEALEKEYKSFMEQRKKLEIKLNVKGIFDVKEKKLLKSEIEKVDMEIAEIVQRTLELGGEELERRFDLIEQEVL